MVEFKVESEREKKYFSCSHMDSLLIEHNKKFQNLSSTFLCCFDLYQTAAADTFERRLESNRKLK